MPGLWGAESRGEPVLFGLWHGPDRRAAVEERKIVSVLFVDLVDFTSRPDQADPEDVRAMLVPYHTRVKSEIESFGGVVEKFIGDAVMAVFGAPRSLMVTTPSAPCGPASGCSTRSWS